MADTRKVYHKVDGVAELYSIDAAYAVANFPDEWSNEPWPGDTAPVAAPKRARKAEAAAAPSSTGAGAVAAAEAAAAAEAEAAAAAQAPSATNTAT